MGWVLIVALGLTTQVPEREVSASGILPGRERNPWGPEAISARARGELPAVVLTPAQRAWDRWGRAALRDGDLVFRLGDARIVWDLFPLSWFIARATGSRFSHVGVVAVEDDGPVVYHCAAAGVQRQPFAVWMGENVGTAFGVKRLDPSQRRYIPGALGFCRRIFEAQVPFDQEFALDDSRYYCVEFVEKAFRSQGLALSEPVRIGDWENLGQFPVASLSILVGSRFLLRTPISLEQKVYVPGNDREGVWNSRWLDTVALVEPAPIHDTSRPMPSGLGLRGDARIVLSLAIQLNAMHRTLHTARLAALP